VFGHTAIRITDASGKPDLVFNYGTFDSSRPGFIPNFLIGKLDYCLSVDDYESFCYHYTATHSTVIEQVLALSAAEKEKMIALLSDNMLPQHRNYRYSYFYDNCATRPRNLIEQCCDGTLIYPASHARTTFRTLVHQCTDPYSLWYTFGIDLLIGSGADSIITNTDEQFLSVKLMESLERTGVAVAGLQTPIVASSSVIIDAGSDNIPHSTGAGFSPMLAGWCLLTLCLLLLCRRFFLNKSSRYFFSALFFITGLAGCLLFLISVCSTHPCTYPNWNLFWIHPLQLIPAVGFLLKKTYPPVRWYHWSNFVLLSFLLLGWSLIPQRLNAAFIPFILCLWVISGYMSIIDAKLRK
jgi:hypothetical protein